MSTINIERLRVTTTNGGFTINYERTLITYSSTTSWTVVDRPEPISMGPIVHDAEEVTS